MDRLASSQTILALLGVLLAGSSAGATIRAFEPNRGQADPEVEFVARGGGHQVFLSGGQAVLSFAGRPGEAGPTRVRMRLMGARATPGVGRAPLRGRVHYLRQPGNRSSIRDLPLFTEVEYADVYPGIGLLYRSLEGRLEYDFTVAPGADPGLIRLRFEGARRVRLDPDGDLEIETAAGDVVHRAPRLYQERDGKEERVEGRFVVRGRTATFSLGRHDRSRALVIDPVVELASYLGGSSEDNVADVAVDDAGNVYVTGTTRSLDFPVKGSPLQGGCALSVMDCSDVFVAKIDPHATGPAALVWATYLGGPEREVAYGAAVSRQGHVYVVGETASVSFPTTPGSYQPACRLNPSGTCSAGFVSKLTPDGGALVFSSFLSGGFNPQWGTAAYDQAQGVAVDPDGYAYVVGSTASSSFPVTPGALQPASGGLRDAFVARFDPSGTAGYVSYLGGSGSDDYVTVAADAAGNAYVTGSTSSPNFPTRNPLQGAIKGYGDCFLSKIDPTGASLVYSTYLGGESGHENCLGVGVDSAGEASVTGQTTATDLPLVNAIRGPNYYTDSMGDGFVMKLDAQGAAFVFSTYLGGIYSDFGSDVAVDQDRNVYVAGNTNSPDFPVRNPVQAHRGPEMFVTKFEPRGSVLFSTSWGLGPFSAPAVAVAAAGRIVIADEMNSGLPVVDPFQPGFNGWDISGYVSVIDPFPEKGLGFYTLAPCRLVDTRLPPGPLGGPALVAQWEREFVAVGACGVPPGARALSLNVTITAPGAAGNLTLFPAHAAQPLASTLNYAAGQTRAGNTVLSLSPTGSMRALASQPAGTAHLILDVNGYFAPPADLVVEVGSAAAHAYAPGRIWVRAGQTVAWRNVGSVTHTATHGGGAFDTGPIPPGRASAPVVMTTTGVLEYGCDLHPGALAILEVR